MCTQEWQGQGSTSHLLYTLPSSSQLEQTLSYTRTISQLPQLCFDMVHWSHPQEQWEHYSWLEGEIKTTWHIPSRGCSVVIAAVVTALMAQARGHAWVQFLVTASFSFSSMLSTSWTWGIPRLRALYALASTPAVENHSTIMEKVWTPHHV